MAEFISTYQGINYKVPESNKHAKFTRGRLSTNDEQTISYLREHQDYGSTLTELGGAGGKSMTVDVHFCQAPGCDRVFKTKAALLAHMRSHKNEVREDNKDNGNEGDGLNGDA